MVIVSKDGYLEEEIEQKRNRLYELLENGGQEEIIKFSQELDLLINEYTNSAFQTKKNSC